MDVNRVLDTYYAITRQYEKMPNSEMTEHLYPMKGQNIITSWTL